jgi:sterol desaturase/sphingolipid hydroxylase (fatty acid hydroxylase superfamily)
MHFLLHQKAAQNFFKKLVKYHIYHHCKYHDKCYGVSVTWWDDLFGTVPGKSCSVSQRIINFYFNKESNAKKIKPGIIIRGKKLVQIIK